MGEGGSQRSHSLGDFFAAQNSFVALKEDPKQTLCSLLTCKYFHVEDQLYYLQYLSSRHKEK